MTDQQSSNAVSAVIEEYVAACAVADTDALQAVFHPDANMSGFLAGQCMTGGVAPFIDAVANNPPPGNDYTSQISDIEVIDGVATAILREQNFMGLAFTNFFQLLNSDGKWLIVAKLFQSS